LAELLTDTDRVTVEVKGRDKEGEEVISKPLHKKNPDVGEKPMVFSSKLLMEQEDAASFGDNEEVSPGRLNSMP
jgi:glutamyl-tRNA synthetase